MTNRHYIIRGGVEGRERLRIQSRLLWPTTRALFERVGVRPGMACLDVGCGGGDVAVELARLVGSGGWVVGTDLDDEQLALARREAAAQGIDNVEFRHADIVDGGEAAAYDLVYARFLLTHLPDPAGALAKLAPVLRPGGVIVVEDIDCGGFFCYPNSEALTNLVALYTETAQRRGVDPYIGQRLPRLLGDGGFAHVDLQVVQPAALEGELKTVLTLTLESIAPAVQAEGLATPAEFDRMVGELYAYARDPSTVMSYPRIVQTWGQRTAA